jgi:hypothetical protein
MSEEDREWLEQAMKQYTFDEAGKLKEIVQQMKHDVNANFQVENGAKSGDELYEMLEQLQEIIEMHERNTLNFFVMGGMEFLLAFI